MPDSASAKPPQSFMAGLLPAIIEELSSHYPKIAVHVEFAQHATTDFRELRERNVDFVLGRISEPFPHDDINGPAGLEIRLPF